VMRELEERLCSTFRNWRRAEEGESNVKDGDDNEHVNKRVRGLHQADTGDGQPYSFPASQALCRTLLSDEFWTESAITSCSFLLLTTLQWPTRTPHEFNFLLAPLRAALFQT